MSDTSSLHDPVVNETVHYISNNFVICHFKSLSGISKINLIIGYSPATLYYLKTMLFKCTLIIEVYYFVLCFTLI